ncbi:MAG: T9SS type A sorting domain-containing protein [Candidatus Azobacteroides sp.]|nr:T9SS type A sorting domain-containing protein [Candidatus Azobacteroides sp.]
MKKIVLFLLLTLLYTGNTWGQEYAFDLTLKLKSREHHIEAASYFKVTFTYQNGATDIWTEGLFGREFNDGSIWQSNYAIKCSVSNPITKITIYAEHRDDPAGSSNNRLRGSNTNTLDIPLSDYPCKDYVVNNKLLGDYDGGSTLDIKLKPLSGVWEIKTAITTTLTLSRQLINVTFGDGSFKTLEPAFTYQQRERTYYLDENKSGIKEISVTNNNNMNAYTFNQPLYPPLGSSFEIRTTNVTTKFEIAYLKNSLYQTPATGILPVNDQIEITTKEFHSRHQWQYSLTPPDASGNQVWNNMPYNVNTQSGTVTFSGYDLLGENSANYIGRDIYFKAVYNCAVPVQETYTLPLNVRLSTPGILSVTPVNKICNGGADGRFKIQLDRSLLSGERLLADYKNLTTSATGSTSDPVLDENNSFYIDNLDAGDYEIQISGFYNGISTYSDGVNHKKTGEIESFPPLSYSTAGLTNITCYGTGNGTITITVSGGDGNYTLHWGKQGENYTTAPFTSPTQTILSGLEPGVYEYYVTDSHDCELRNPDGTIKTIQVAITQPAKALDFSFPAPVLPSGYGRSDGSVTLEGDGGTPAPGTGYTATWKNNLTGQTVTTVENDPSGAKFRTTAKNIPAGTYLVEVRDANNCGFTDEITIGRPDELVVNIENTLPVLCNGDTNGELVAHAQGGVLDPGQVYDYRWYKKNGADYQAIPLYTDSIASGLGKGDYKVEVKDRSRVVNITEKEFSLSEPEALTATLSKQDVTCYGGDNGSIRVDVSGGAGNYSLYYKSRDDDDYSDPVSIPGNTFTVDGLTADEYRLYITDGNNCAASISGASVASVIISQPAQALDISSSAVKPVSGFGRSDGNIEIKVQGGTPNPTGPFYTITWKDASGTPIASSESSDADGIFTSKTENLPQGIYTVEIKDKNYDGTADACYVVAAFTVIQPELLTLQPENTSGVYCYGETTGMLVANAKGGVPGNFSGRPYSYEWYSVTNGTATLLPDRIDDTADHLPAGSYQVRVEDAADPVNTVESDVFEITQPTPVTTVLTTRNISCHGLNDGFIRIETAGGVGDYKLFLKKDEDADYREHPIESDNKTFRIDNLYSGNYIIYILDANNCYAKINGEDIHEITLMQPAEPLTISAVTKVDASGYGRSDGNIKITPEGGTPNPDGTYNISWKNEAGQTLSATNSLENGKYISLLNNIPEGNYSVEVKDGNYAGAYPDADASCTASEFYSISEPDELLAAVEETGVISCYGMSDGRLVVHATGGIRNPAEEQPLYFYKWYKEGPNGVYNLLANERDSILSDRPAGIYKVEIEDYSRTPNTVSVIYNLRQPDLLQASATDISITCGQTATVSATVTGGTAPYTYEWSMGDDTQSVAGVSPGRYFVFVTDSRGCLTTAIAKVSTPEGLRVESTVASPVCHGASDGSITLQVTGGTAPYTYRWNNGTAGKDLIGIGAGQYSVTVTDKDGCSFTDNFILIDPEPLTVSLGEDRTLCNGQSLRLAPAVTDPDTQFSWTGPDSFKASSPEITVNTAGTYRLAITDSKGCQATDEINIRVKDVDISSEIFVSTEVFTGDTIVIANISNPDPDSVDWLIENTDSLQVVETDEFYARVIFYYPGHYTIGFRAHKDDCYQEIRKTVTAVEPEQTPGREPGESMINNFYVYPNPNDGNFHVRIELTGTSAIRLRMINAGTGHVASDKKYNGQKDYDLPYSLPLSPGVYIIVLETASGYMNIKMIVTG